MKMSFLTLRDRLGRHRTGAGAMRHHPPEAAEDRRGAGAQHAAGTVSVGGELSAPRVVCDGRGALGEWIAATGAVPGTRNNGGWCLHRQRKTSPNCPQYLPDTPNPSKIILQHRSCNKRVSSVAPSVLRDLMSGLGSSNPLRPVCEPPQTRPRASSFFLYAAASAGPPSTPL